RFRPPDLGRYASVSRNPIASSSISYVDLLSGTGRAHYACNRLHQQIPLRLLGCELLSSGGGQAVILRTAIQFRLLPLRRDEATGLQTVERRVQGSALYLQNIGRTLPNSLPDAMPVLRSPLQSAQNQHVKSALEQVQAVFRCVAFWHCLEDILVDYRIAV